MVRVLIVDDSAYMRFVLQRGLEEDPELIVVDTARDGLDALAKIEALKPDVVTLDLEMPRMDGFETLRRLMTGSPLPVIILSSLSQEGADATVRALRLGAVDFVPKPTRGALDFQAVKQELVAKIKQIAGLNSSRLGLPRSVPAIERTVTERPVRLRETRGIVVIGTSTGGPRALHEVVPHLPATLPCGVLIVQHMPPGFTKSLAQRLDEISPLQVKEAASGDRVQPGLALLAPGNYHMTVSSGGYISLNQNPAQHGVRPSVDVTMESAAESYGPATIGVILTGMGADGTRGAALIKRSGGQVIAEDESTCVIYGMPRSAVEAKVVDFTAPLDRIASEISSLAGARRTASRTAASA